MEAELGLADRALGVTEWEKQEIAQAAQRAHRALTGGSLKQLRLELTGRGKEGDHPPLPLLAGIDQSTLRSILDTAASLQPTLLAVNRTLASFNYLTRIAGRKREEYIEKVLPLKLSKLVSEHRVPLPNSPLSDLDETVSALNESKAIIVGRMTELLPSKESLVEALRLAREREFEQKKGALRTEANRLRDEIRELSVVEQLRIQELEQKLENELRTFFMNKPPSLWKAISTQLRDMRLAGYATSMKSRLNEIATGVLSPDFLMKCMEVASK